jgi:hypothetical protein
MQIDRERETGKKQEEKKAPDSFSLLHFPDA